MTVSVVIPAFNEEKYIDRCLKSVLNQSISADEIIIVNNNSTDNTAKIIAKYPVKVILEKRPGIIQTRNTGFNHASSDIILRTDADTQVPYTWIEKIKGYLHKHSCDALLGASYYKEIPISLISPFYLGLVQLVKQKFGIYPLFGPNMAIYKKVWSKIFTSLCTSEKDVHEDVDIALHLRDIGGTICFDPNNITLASARRLIFKPHSFFIEYPYRMMRMKKSHG